jgi:hypothetical protein
MLQELTHMDRITQLQDEIQQVRREGPSSLDFHVFTRLRAARAHHVEQYTVLDDEVDVHANLCSYSSHEGAERGQIRSPGGAGR